jgi:diaminohydroxyphosphoribosylaminopyrimidine deaminase/5-amino-6-(5-phosphoribosylamino)uracil reductase
MSAGSIIQGSKEKHTIDNMYMARCLQLAAFGAGYTAPNPMVGAVLVHRGRIIGEGYHQEYGGPHAEVRCISSVLPKDRSLIPLSTLYVSLEPCSHYGKTPPCTKLILEHQIRNVVIGCRDPFPLVDGRGIETLKTAGVDLVFPVLEKESQEMNRRFFTFHREKRPYVVLKWARSADGKIAGADGTGVKISGPLSNRLVHRWRTEEAGILIGKNTAMRDNPQLTARLWTGKNPVRIVLDGFLSLPEGLHVFDRKVPTVILNNVRDELSENLIRKKTDTRDTDAILESLYGLGIQSVLVEGGASILQSFIDSGRWDEIRTITAENLQMPGGLPGPVMPACRLTKTETWGSDTVRWFEK